MDNKTEFLVQKIVEGIQEKKGTRIVVADLGGVEDSICKCFVVCQGNSPSQVTAIADSVKDYVRKQAGEKVSGMDGYRNAQWILLDYADVLVHIFLPEVREYYQIESLWADAKLTEISDLD